MADMPAFGWLNGSIVPIERCVVHARSQGGFWGANVFEGIRAYWLERESSFATFRLGDHLERLRWSRRALHMPPPFTDEDIRRAVTELVEVNRLCVDLHICIVAYFDTGPNFDSLGYTEECGMHITVIAAPRSTRYPDGARLCVSSWRRISDDSMPPRIKTGANYHNSRLAHHEAVRNGFDTALLLNQRGTVAEATNCCLVMVRDGRLITPPGTAGAFEGLTLDTLGVLASARLGIELERREIDRSELYMADELMLCGTLAEVQPVVSIDHLPIGDGEPGPLTRRLQALYDEAVHDPSGPWGWTTMVGLPAPTGERVPV